MSGAALGWSSLSKDTKALAVRLAMVAGAGSASAIAEKLGTTRNAVIGVAHRNRIALPGIYPPNQHSIAGRAAAEARRRSARGASA